MVKQCLPCQIQMQTHTTVYDRIRTHTKYRYTYKPIYTSKCRCKHKRICICIYTGKNKPRPTPKNRPESLAATGAPVCWAPAPQRVQTQTISQGFSTFSTELSTRWSKPVGSLDFLANVHRTFSENLEDFSKKGLEFPTDCVIILSIAWHSLLSSAKNPRKRGFTI